MCSSDLEWQENPDTFGSLMIRPVFGKGNGLTITSIETERASLPWPNPAESEFHLPAGATSIRVTDVTGKIIETESIAAYDKSVMVRVINQSSGLRIVRWQQGGKVYTARIIIGRP